MYSIQIGRNRVNSPIVDFSRKVEFIVEAS